MTRYVCVHGHFYQPPRENPWLEVVEQQDAAYPFHDWNERITAECYAPNARARVLDGEGRISWLLNNYAHLSFNVGPTLLGWMHTSAPETYAAIIDADRQSARRFGGHGSAMAQVHSHTILPLANDRDRRTEIRWALIDFRHHFGREPEGIWLPETAVDVATLEVLAEHGLRFTVLSPYQAARVRPVGASSWTPVDHGDIDPRMPYLVRLPSGRSIAVFFYDSAIAHAVAFEGVLTSADRFVRRLVGGFDGRDHPQLVSIATDGESYGHHHRHGEMALAATLQRLEARDDVSLTNYAQFLELCPPTHEVEVVENSSWSCAHGVERWRTDCGCGAEGGAHQRWRAPLRSALDWLRDGLGRLYESHATPLLTDPWAARDDYHAVVLDREAALEDFLDRHAARPLDADERTRALRLLEVQRQALLMYSSCGWFFEELSRLEPVQILRYAARAIQFARVATGQDELEAPFVARLAAAESNDPTYRDGRGVWEQLIAPEVIELDQVAAHVAISGLTWPYGHTERIGAYEVTRQGHRELEAGSAKLATGRLTVRSTVTLSRTQVEFAVLHLGDHNFTCGLRPRGSDEAFKRLVTRLEASFDTADFLRVIRGIDDAFEGESYSLRSLFRDEQRRILHAVLADTLEETERTYRSIFRTRAPMMRYLADLNIALPAGLLSAAEVVLNADLDARLAHRSVDPAEVRELLEEARRFAIQLDGEGLGHTLSSTIAGISHEVGEILATSRERFTTYDARHATTLERIHGLIEVVAIVPFDADLAPAQDLLWTTLQQHQAALRARADDDDAVAQRWCAELASLADALGVAANELVRHGRSDTVGAVPDPSR